MATKRASSPKASQRKVSKAQVEDYNKFLQDELTKFVGKGGPPGGRTGPPIGLPAAVPLAQYGEHLRGAATAAKASHSSAIPAAAVTNTPSSPQPFAGAQQWPGHVTQWPGHLAHYHTDDLATLAKRNSSPTLQKTTGVPNGEADAAALKAKQAAEAAELKAKGEAAAKAAAEAAELKARGEAEAKAAAEAAELKGRLEAEAKAAVEAAALKEKLENDAKAGIEAATLKAALEAEAKVAAEVAQLKAKLEADAKAAAEAAEVKARKEADARAAAEVGRKAIPPELAVPVVVANNTVDSSEVTLSGCFDQGNRGRLCRNIDSAVDIIVDER